MMRVRIIKRRGNSIEMNQINIKVRQKCFGMKKRLLIMMSILVPFFSFSQHIHDSIIVDRYGQLIHVDFKNKITEDAQLRRDAMADQSYYNSLHPPVRDIYGGLLNSKEKLHLKKTGYFNIQKLKNGNVIMVNPLGNLYFSIGVNGVGYTGDTYTLVRGRKHIYQWLPECKTHKSQQDDRYSAAYLHGNADHFSFYVANRIRKYNQSFDETTFYNESVARLKKWGFNSEGGFSNTPQQGNINFPQVRFASLPDLRISGSSLYDVFKPGFSDDVHETFKKQPILAMARNPLIIGYFFGNEIDYHQFKNIVPSKKASEVATKKALVDYLVKRYINIASFNSAWQASYDSFNDLYESAIGISTETAVMDMLDFFEIYLDTFYSIVVKEFRKFDPNHLLLGDRYFTAVMSDDHLRERICKVAGRHLDVMSYNYYTYDVDIERLQSMHHTSGLPIMLTEYHYGDPTQGQTSAIQMMDNEIEKGYAYRNYVENIAASGFVVGAHWFEYLDQAVTGRWFQGYNGEGFGIGLLNVADRPYKDFLASVMKTNYCIYDLVLGKKLPYRYTFSAGKSNRSLSNSITIFKTMHPITIDGMMDSYWPYGEAIVLTDKDRVMGVQQQNSSAHINLAYDEKYLYLIAHIKDSTPMTNSFAGADVWNGDAIEIFVGPVNHEQGGALQVKDRQVVLAATSGENPHYYWFGNTLTQPKINMAIKADADKKGYTMEAALPLKELNIEEIFKAKKIRFDIGFNDGNDRQRNAQYMWNGTENNSQRRDNWGILIFN